MTMKTCLRCGLFLLCVWMVCLPASGEERKRYMLEGIATPAVFARIIEKPQDRGPGAASLVKGFGCTLLDYYVGIHNFKNYLVLECSQDADLASLQLILYSSGAISEISTTQIMTSAELESAARRARKSSGTYRPPVPKQD